MKSPFPGMDPYLESPALWPDLHAGLIKATQHLLNLMVRPRYVCRVEERLYLTPDPYPALMKVRIPDVNVSRTPVAAGAVSAASVEWPHGEEYRLLEVEEVGEPLREQYAVVRRVDSGRVVTVIEVLSPANKAAGSEARREYLEKRAELLHSEAHLVEIDLLRTGLRPVALPYDPPDHYAVFLNRWPHRHRTQALIWSVPKPLPTVPIPLESPDPAAKLDLQNALALAYEWGAYDASIDYRQPPDPPLSPEYADWAEHVVAKAFSSGVD